MGRYNNHIIKFIFLIYYAQMNYYINYFNHIYKHILKLILQKKSQL